MHSPCAHCVQMCILLVVYHIRKRPGQAMQLVVSMLKTEVKLAMKLLFEGWDFFSDTWVLVNDVLPGNSLVSDLVALWLVLCTPSGPISYVTYARI